VYIVYTTLVLTVDQLNLFCFCCIFSWHLHCVRLSRDNESQRPRIAQIPLRRLCDKVRGADKVHGLCRGLCPRTFSFFVTN